MKIFQNDQDLIDGGFSSIEPINNLFTSPIRNVSIKYSEPLSKATDQQLFQTNVEVLDIQKRNPNLQVTRI